METPLLRGAAVLLLLAVAAGIAVRKLLLIYRLIRLGSGPVPLAPMGVRLRDLVVQVLAHSKVLRGPASGILHFFIFWGFLVLLSTIVQAFGEAFVPGWTLPVVGAAPWFAFLQDVFIVLVLVGIGIALGLRLARRPKRLAGQDPVGAYMILGLIVGIMMTLLLSRATAAVLDAPQWAAGAVVSRFVAGWVAGAAPGTGGGGAAGGGRPGPWSRGSWPAGSPGSPTPTMDRTILFTLFKDKSAYSKSSLGSPRAST